MTLRIIFLIFMVQTLWETINIETQAGVSSITSKSIIISKNAERFRSSLFLSY